MSTGGFLVVPCRSAAEMRRNNAVVMPVGWFGGHVTFSSMAITPLGVPRVETVRTASWRSRLREAMTR